MNKNNVLSVCQGIFQPFSKTTTSHHCTATTGPLTLTNESAVEFKTEIKDFGNIDSSCLISQ